MRARASNDGQQIDRVQKRPISCREMEHLRPPGRRPQLSGPPTGGVNSITCRFRAATKSRLKRWSSARRKEVRIIELFALFTERRSDLSNRSCRRLGATQL